MNDDKPSALTNLFSALLLFFCIGCLMAIGVGLARGF